MLTEMSDCDSCNHAIVFLTKGTCLIDVSMIAESEVVRFVVVELWSEVRGRWKMGFVVVGVVEKEGSNNAPIPRLPRF